MVPKDFEANDLVWAKMKGYPYWPGKIMTPPADAKPKKNHHYVYFFGSNNHAWIADEFIELHGQKMLQKYGERKGGELFRKAVETLVEQSKDVSKYHSLTGKIDDASDDEESPKKSVNIVSRFKSKSPLGYTTHQRFKKKLSMKKVISISRASGEKSARKRPRSSGQHEPDCCSNFTPGRMDGSTANSTGQNTSSVYRADKPSERKVNRSILERQRIPLPITPTVELAYQSDVFKKKKIQPTHKKIGFLGLSNIGQGLVKNLCHSGHSITIWNEKPEECKRFADHFKIKIADTPAELIQTVDIAICCTSDPEISKKIVEGYDGILAGLEHSRGSKSFVEMTPIDPKMSLMFATEITSKGGRYLEAPFCGSGIEAVEGTLLIVAAGDQTVYDDCKSCFAAISKKHMFISAEVGNASKLNIVHNMLIGTIYACLGEAFSLVDECNLRGEHFIHVIKTGSLNSSGVLHHLMSIFYKNYTPHLTVKEMQKNFNMGLTFGNGISQHSSIFANANELYKRCIAMKYGDHDISAVYEGTY